MRIPERISRIMARKSNPEKEKAASGLVPAKPRRSTTAARPRRSTAAAKKPVPPVGESETETVLAVSASESSHGMEPSREAIARLAYLYWLDRGGQQGSAEEDWLRAEQELRQSSEPMQ
jgi:hypothetical protein